jgi:hypothetical protein
MDCLEFRRRLGSEPHVIDPEARAHLAICAACAALTAEAQAFEARLSAAFSVPLPGGLTERILAAQRADVAAASAPPSRNIGSRRVGWIALAAAACLVLAFGVVRYQNAAASLPNLVAAHVTSPDERDALALTAAVPTSDIEHAFADRGVKLADTPPPVAYVSECGIGRWRSVHMVAHEADGPVSVIYIAQQRAAEITNVRRAGMATREVPLADGTLFMLAQTDAHFDALEHAWRNAIEGSPKVAAGSY